MSERDFRLRGTVDGLMDQTARLERMRNYLDSVIEHNRAVTRQALVMEARLRKDGDPQRVAGMVTSEAATSDVMD